MPPIRVTRTLLAATAALLVAAAPAAAQSSSIGGKISPDRGRPGTPLRLTLNFALDPAPGQAPGTLNRAVLQFPPNATVNGKLFPSCSADTINKAGGRFTKCPKGSQIGKGSLKGDVFNLDLSMVPGRVTLFNGPGGKSITVHIYLTNPALISIAFQAPLVKTKGRYGYKLTAPVPEGLQTLIQPDSFAGLRTFTSTVGITKKVKGRTRGYIEAKRCPKNGRVPVAGQFFFNETPSTSATGEIKCRPL
jgi:hypothetical protein